MSSSIILSPILTDASVSVLAEAKAYRDELLVSAGTVTTVKDRIDADDATSILRSLSSWLKTIESQHREAKAPILDLGRKIDSLKKELITAVEAEELRIKKVLGTYEAEERRKAEEARREAEYKAALVAQEAKKKADEERRNADTAEQADRAVDVIVEKAQEQIQEIKQAAASMQPVRNAGTMVRKTVCFEVTDIAALYAHHPEMVTLEPNGSAIRAILKANPNLKVAGLKHWTEDTLSIR